MAQSILTPELEKLVAAKVDSGRYGSPSEVVETAMQLLEAHEERESERAVHRAQVDLGVAQADAGQLVSVSFDEFKRLARERFVG